MSHSSTGYHYAAARAATFVPDVERGRGAWTKIGKPNGSTNYTYVAATTTTPAPPVDGRLRDDDNLRAVHLAVKHSIQPAIGLPPGACDGLLGPGSLAQMKRWQESQGLTPDGFFGRKSAAKAFRPLVERAARAAGIPAAHLHGIIAHESAYDPGAVGYATPADRGLAQVSLAHHGPGTADGFTEAQVHTASWAIDYNAARLAGARRLFGATGADVRDVRVRAALLEHNNPVNARHLAATGEYRTAQARDYVEAVLRAVETF